ncbi:MAG: PAP/fibrillin family protein [Synechococcaceae cyanobacterium]|nr:PAP/fibrillin family protein [Synechococcaceae cyanobacterium]
MDATPTTTTPQATAGARQELLALLREGGRGAANRSSERVRTLLEQLEKGHPADLARDGDSLKGVWELRWSSSSLPYLAVAPWLENLQVLDPGRGRGMNLLRLAGPLGPLAGIAVQARIAVEGPQRVSVRFERGGWLGPRLGERRLELFRQVKQSYPAWLDITVLDRDLRVCRGNAGTLFALLRRTDLEVEALLG